MFCKGFRIALLVCVPAFVAGCEASKSSNPLSPSVAGPIPGVSISAPRLLEPSNGSEIDKNRQPISLVVENATSTGVRPLNYLFEVATDANFNAKVFSRSGVPPGNGRTSLKLPSPLDPEKTYYWRARAQDGANTGPFASSTTFHVKTPVALQAPSLRSPVNGARVAALPTPFVFGNAARSGPVGSVSYTIQISANDSFTAIVAQVNVGEGGGQTSATLGQGLAADKLYYWRARAFDQKNTGPWSGIQTFRTPAVPGGGTPPPPPRPPPGGGKPGSCASSSGPTIAKCIQAKYPDKTVPTSNLDQRRTNMMFLRDRMIEAAICGGFDAGWNLKRGGPELSIDFFAYRKNGLTYGVDIAFDYDNFRNTLKLQWLEDGPGSKMKDYTPRPKCN
jgi:hypothetical protein